MMIHRQSLLMRLVTHDVQSAGVSSTIAEETAESNALNSQMMFKAERDVLAHLGFEEYGVVQQEVIAFKTEMEVQLSQFNDKCLTQYSGQGELFKRGGFRDSSWQVALDVPTLEIFPPHSTQARWFEYSNGQLRCKLRRGS